MRVLAAHLRVGDVILPPAKDGAGADTIGGEEVLEVRQDPDTVTFLTRSGRFVTVGADRTVDVAPRNDVLLG